MMNEQLIIICNGIEFQINKESAILSKKIKDQLNVSPIIIDDIVSTVFSQIIEYLNYRAGEPSNILEKSIQSNQQLSDLMDDKDFEFLQEKSMKELINMAEAVCEDTLDIPCLKYLIAVAISWKINQLKNINEESIIALINQS